MMFVLITISGKQYTITMVTRPRHTKVVKFYLVLSSSSRAGSDIPCGNCGLFGESDRALETESWHHGCRMTRQWDRCRSSVMYRLIELGNRSRQSL